MKTIWAGFRCPMCAAETFVSSTRDDIDAEKIWSAPGECGHCSLIIESQKDKYRINVPCITCSTPHRYTVGEKLLFERESLVLQCAYSGVDCFFAADSPDKAREAMRVSDEEVMRVISLKEGRDTDVTVEDSLRSAGDMVIDSSEGGDVDFYNPEIASDMLFLVKDMALEGKLGCSCGNREPDIRIKSDCIEFLCPKCGRSLTLYTRSTSDRARLEDMSEILLK